MAGTDGVGTKLKYAFVLDRHDTVGIDCVAMCVNDIVCQGAKPLIFLDYIALSRLVPQKVAMIVKGVSEGCRQAGCALIGERQPKCRAFTPTTTTTWRGSRWASPRKNKIINGSGIKRGRQTCGFEIQRSAQQRLFSCEKAFPSRKRGFGRVSTRSLESPPLRRF